VWHYILSPVVVCTVYGTHAVLRSLNFTMLFAYFLKRRTLGTPRLYRAAIELALPTEAHLGIFGRTWVTRKRGPSNRPQNFGQKCDILWPFAPFYRVFWHAKVYLVQYDFL